MTTLVFEEHDTSAIHVVDVRRVFLAAFTGRDPEVVAQHIHELAAIGVTAPASTPSVFELNHTSVRQTGALVVNGSNTSGEVEAVVIRSDDQLLLTVGSDHTDRELEKTDIAASKAVCHKVVGTQCISLGKIDDWDAIEARLYADGQLCQRGELRLLMPLEEILRCLREQHGTVLSNGEVLFLGTIPSKVSLSPSSRFSAELRLADGTRLSLTYQVTDVSGAHNLPLRKPELEFFDVDTVEWTPIQGTRGQSVRILASDPGSGIATRMLRFEPGADTSEMGVLRHDFWEEVYILSGELHDLTLNHVFPTGTYACRPPGMPHGPWKSEEGCITFEVRYPAV